MKKSRAVKEIRAFNRFYTNIIGVMNRNFLDSPFSLTEVRVMFEIYYDEKATVRKIKNLLMVDEGYLSRTIDKLRKRGIVSKKQSEIDRRSYILSLTVQGKKIFEKIELRQNESVRSLIDTLTQEELDELIKTMQRIRSLLSNSGENL
jgi:DNA-binding MarR family transcriptional regulator